MLSKLAKHVMIDLETMDTRPSAAILSIGAVAFDPYSNEIGRAVNITVDMAGQQGLGRTIDARTVYWWLEQSQAAREALLEDRVNLPVALQRLRHYLLDNVDMSDFRVWCHGPSFDAAILEDAHRALNHHLPWKYNASRDTRTLYEAAGVDLARLPREGTFHRAASDALHQAKAVQLAFRILRGPVPMVCEGCGSRKNQHAINELQKAGDPIIACCPERRLVCVEARPSLTEAAPRPNDPWRRVDLTRMTIAERAITEAMHAVEALPGDVRLTEAVTLLQSARNKVADFVDGVGA